MDDVCQTCKGTRHKWGAVFGAYSQGPCPDCAATRALWTEERVIAERPKVKITTWMMPEPYEVDVYRGPNGTLELAEDTGSRIIHIRYVRPSLVVDALNADRPIRL